ncbi:uncharacterized protein LOC142318736 [Lycorma delicatula]|uniref:uncharacterized protein LOC142318736 n=1 Tax=Lycorma delicatula TaxID=130591 RepID=UPI003F50EF23
MNSVLTSILFFLCASSIINSEAGVIRKMTELSAAWDKLIQVLSELGEMELRDKMMLNKKIYDEKHLAEYHNDLEDVKQDPSYEKNEAIKDVNMCVTVACNLGCVASGHRYGRCIHGHCNCF